MNDGNGGPGPNRQLLLGDAFALPLQDECIDVVVADPPYEGKARGKRGIHVRDVGYVTFSGRGWWHEAWRVLKPSGHFYVFAAIKELKAWFDFPEKPVDIIAWHQPNSPSLSASWRRGVGSRAPAWRPILHWQKPPLQAIPWPDGFVQANHIQAPAVQSRMKEALPWPNQLPNRLLRWLLAPHQGLVLDLFAGTGTAAAAAVGLGLATVAVEMAPRGLTLARRRALMAPLFTGDSS